MAISRLTSKDNPLLKKIRLIASGSRRAPSGFAVAEGMRVLAELDPDTFRIEAVLASESFGASGKENALLQRWLANDVRICKVDENLFRSVSDVRAPQGAIALVRFPERTLDAVEPGRNALVLFACGIRDPGNLGTVIRAATAAGASFVCTGKETVSARNPKAIRASAGAVFRIPIVESIGTVDFLAYCRRHSIRAYRTDVIEGSPHTRVDLSAPCAIVLGNEGSGVPQHEWSALPAIRIPMAAGVESLNVAIAGAVILFEALRQRMSNSP